ncbi:dTDP-4-dehydrorhamnose 3,5-epimerase family protein [Micromonospora sp. NPDC000089]|uniref:dTDP-4-dehydrorhamnose 3,5-epimerase family protein n=1 Tax=unclassified Micromonospora TaxID=2617518 RepID=UPI00367D3254
MSRAGLNNRSMAVRPLDISGAFLISSRSFTDERGAFFEVYREDVLTEVLGYPPRIVQTNYSVSHSNVLRGIHGAAVPPGLAKLVTCVRGLMLDFVVDLRTGSPTFGKWDMIILNGHDASSVYVEEGLGHAFVALVDDTCVQYQLSELYRPQDVITVHPLDPEIGLPLRLPDGPVLSDRDAAAPTLSEAAELGLLPSYDSCMALRGARPHLTAVSDAPAPS